MKKLYLCTCVETDDDDEPVGSQDIYVLAVDFSEAGNAALVWMVVNKWRYNSHVSVIELIGSPYGKTSMPLATA